MTWSKFVDILRPRVEGMFQQWFSPASVTEALAMVYAGARGETAAQMQKALRFQGSPAELAAALTALQASAGRPTYFLGAQVIENHDYGLRINGLRTGAPAEKNGFHLGDLLFTIDGRVLRTQSDYDQAIDRCGPEVVIEAYDIREGRPVQRKVALAEVAAAAAQGQLTVTNGLWVQSGYPIVDAFHDLLAGGFHADVAPADFQQNPDAACRLINDWMKAKTAGRVPSVVESLLPSTRLVVANAVTMQATWQSPFLPEQTVASPFYPLVGSTVQVATMRHRGRFIYARGEGLKLLEMPYRGGRLSMVVVLPGDRQGLPELERSLTSQRLSALLTSMQRTEVEISLPRFEVESATSLNAALEAIGVRLAFSQDADLSGIDGSHRLAIGLVAHRAMVKVDERGTEAAAGSAVVVATKGAYPGRPEVFQADHPFLFLVRDSQTGAIWFMGRCMKP
jgi:serpin B